MQKIKYIHTKTVLFSTKESNKTAAKSCCNLASYVILSVLIGG